MKKAVLITGGAARIGAHFARGLSNEGWAVIIHYLRSEQRAEALAQDINRSGGEAYTVKANLSIPQECDKLITQAADRAGRPLTALINNASTFQDDRIDSLSRAQYDYHMDANLRAPIFLAQKFAKQAPKEASIINMIDQRILKPNPQFFSYSLSKAGLHWVTTTLAQALAPSIRVNGIGPGPTLQNSGQSEAEFAEEAENTLLGHSSPPEDLLRAVLYLLNTPSVTGQFLAVDSGQHLRWETPDIKLDKGP